MTQTLFFFNFFFFFFFFFFLLLATVPRCKEGATPFLVFFTLPLIPTFIMLSVKQGGIKYQFLSLVVLSPYFLVNW